MLLKPLSFKRHRFPAEVIRHAVWLYFRFTVSFRDSYRSALRELKLIHLHQPSRLRENNRT